MSGRAGKIKWPKQARPKAICGQCEHSCQWHRQSQASIENGHTSYAGAACYFPGCGCMGYVRRDAPR